MNFNKVIIGGHITRDLEPCRFTPSGLPVADFSIAINEKYKDREEVIFVDITVWGKTAENCVQYLKKGAGVLVEGKLKMDKWADKETGQPRQKMKITGMGVTFLPRGEKRDDSEQAASDDDVPF